MELQEKIKLVRKDRKMTQEEFGDVLGVKKSAIALYEAGKRQPSGSVIKGICNQFGVDYDWLMYGDEPNVIYATDDGDAQAIIDRVLTGENQFAKDVLLKFAKLDTKYWDMIEEIIEQMKE